MLKDLLNNNVKSWSNLFKNLLEIPRDPNHSIAGFKLEEFAHFYFLETEEFRKVYHYSDIPPSLKKKHNLSTKVHLKILLNGDNINQQNKLDEGIFSSQIEGKVWKF